MSAFPNLLSVLFAPLCASFRPSSCRRTLRLFPALLAATVFAATAQAQSVRWEPAASGDPSEIQLVFEDCRPEGDPTLPSVEGITFSFAGRAEQTSIMNFTMTRSVILTYRARSNRSGPISIPAFTVRTDKGNLTVPAFTGGALRSAADANVSSRLEPNPASVWAGQVFDLTYTLDVARRHFNQLGTLVEWNAAPLIAEEWSKPEPFETTVNNEARLHIIQKTRAYTKTPGPLTLNAANQLVNLQSGSIGFGLFQTPRIEQLSVTSNTPAIIVRPLPPAPAGFSGAVGQFQLTSKVVPTNATAGEPITWTLELSGTGNWPDIPGLPQRAVSRDFNVVQPQARRTPAEGKLFDTTISEDVVLVPTKEGTYTLGPVNFTYFDPVAGDYKTISTPRTQITITPATNTSSTQNSEPKTQNESSTAVTSLAPPKLPTPPSAPNAIPRDPLPGSHVTFTPLRPSTLAWLTAAPFAILPILWLILATQRARATDPLRPQREARTRLAATIAQLRQEVPSGSGLSAPGSKLLLQWQHDATILLRIPHAAPPATAITDPAWQQLWLESDRALYSADAQLPSDWTARAEAARAATRLPGFSPLRLFLPRNLFPFVALLTLTFTLPTLLPAADETQNSKPKTQNPEPTVAYRSGDFAAAAKSWSATVAKSPTDAVARHNLSLALAQQDRWPEAAAHATAAFVQNPSNDSVRWQLALASEKSGYIARPLVSFLPPGPAQSLARLASPATWQFALLAASLLITTALALFTYGAYRHPSRLRLFSALAALLLGLFTAAVSASSLHAYRLTAHPDAVLAWRAGTLRSIPTEADNTQKTTTLPPGSLALADRNTFLGWTRLTFENGQTGWVRTEEIIPLWK